jgi:two-component system, cell cycle response regulator
MKKFYAEMKKLGFGDDPSWFALVLFVRNLLHKSSIFSDEQKEAIQGYIFEELAKKDTSPEHLQQVIIRLEKFMVQNIELVKLKREHGYLKEFSNSLVLCINEFLNESFASEQDREKLISKFQNETIKMFEGGEGTDTMLPRLKLLVEDTLLHYRQEAQGWEKKARLLEQTVNIDPLLAPLYNRSALDNHLRKAVRRSQSALVPLSVLMIDIDNFKGVNDAYGHQVGDDVLRTLAKIIYNHASKYNWFVARYGGDELTMVCELSAERALFEADALRLSVQNYEFRPRIGEKLSDVIVKFTISIGVAENKPGISSEQLLDAADKALYYVKRTGRNNVSQYCIIGDEGES